MSCDYQRWGYWRQFRHWYYTNFPEPVRDLFEEVFKEILEDSLDDWMVSERKRRRLQRKRRQDRVAYALEATYLRAKQAARERGETWTPAERKVLADKTRRVLRRIRTSGVPDGMDPVHGKSGLPRISSQAGYAAVYDKLQAVGVSLDSPCDPVYAAIEENTSLSAEERQALIQHVEKIESQLRRGVDVPGIVGCITALQGSAPQIFAQLSRVLETQTAAPIPAG